jgi:branched-chain amino acid transport system ATP-binding protein
MTEPLMKIRGVDAYYGYAQILHGVDLTVHRDPVAIIGRNGMGKTTLCEALMGLAPRVAGSVQLNGQELVGQHPHKIARAGIGYVPQGRRVFPSLTTEEHLRLVVRKGTGWTLDRIYDLFPRLAERRTTGGDQLSGGEQQMLVIARAILSQPRVLLLDEISLGLAPALVARLLPRVKALAEEGLTVVLVEQYAHLALSLGDRAYVLAKGAVVFEGACQELLTETGVLKSAYLRT